MKRQVAEGIKLGTLHESAAAVDVLLEQFAAQRERVEADPRWTRAAKDERIAQLAQEAQANVAVAVERAIKEAVRPLDDAEGQVRARAIAEGGRLDPAVLARAQAMASAAAASDDPVAVWRDAEFLGSPDLSRIVGTAVLSRLHDLAKDAQPGTPAHVALAGFRASFAEWTKGHPSDREQIARLARERENLALRITESARFVGRLFQMGDRTAVGPGFREAPALRGVTGVGYTDIRR